MMPILIGVIHLKSYILRDKLFCGPNNITNSPNISFVSYTYNVLTEYALLYLEARVSFNPWWLDGLQPRSCREFPV